MDDGHGNDRPRGGNVCAQKEAGKACCEPLNADENGLIIGPVMLSRTGAFDLGDNPAFRAVDVDLLWMPTPRTALDDDGYDGLRDRRSLLIAATWATMADEGIEAATVREIARRAGVTPGLIRHHFGSKDDLLREACDALMAHINNRIESAVSSAGIEPGDRLAVFIAASLRPTMTEADSARLWCGYMHLVCADPVLLTRHQQSSHESLACLQGLIADLAQEMPAEMKAKRLDQDSTACAAIIAGMRQRNLMLNGGRRNDAMVRNALRAVSAILQFDLLRFDTFIPELAPGIEDGDG